jgi:hypothetical protein
VTSAAISLVSNLRSAASLQGQDGAQLREIGLDRRLHVGILQLARQCAAVMRDRAVHLAERGGVRRFQIE